MAPKYSLSYTTSLTLVVGTLGGYRRYFDNGFETIYAPTPKFNETTFYAQSEKALSRTSISLKKTYI
jgi:hypothetical protein